MTLERIAYVVNVFPKLSETFIAQELAELRRRGVEVRVLSLRQPTDAIQHQFVSRAGLIDCTEYNAAAFPEIIAEFRPQLIHAHFATEPAAHARQLAAELGLPFTFTAHGYDVYRRPPSDFANRAADARAVITVSQANARYIADTFRVPRDHIRVIPCGIDARRFCQNGPRAEPPRIVCVARLAPIKNISLLLEACFHLRASRVAFHCVVIGDGPCRADLLAQCDRLKLEESITFVGAAEQATVLASWQHAAVGVLTSDREGMPVSLMEAAACAVPVVATAVGGVPELIEHNVTGLVVRPGDACALAHGLERLLTDPMLRSKMGSAARQRAEQLFDVEMQVDRLCTVWKEVV